MATALGAAAAVVAATVALSSLGGGGGGRGAGSGIPGKPARPIPGAFRLAAAPGDGTVWLSWQTVSGCAPVHYRVERSTDPRRGPWDMAASGTDITRFKDINRLNRLSLWYRVTASDCRGGVATSDTVATTPLVRPYSWDFGRQVQGTPGTTEGWTTGPPSPSSGSVAPATPQPAGSGAKGRAKRKKKAQAKRRAAAAGQTPVQPVSPAANGSRAAKGAGVLVVGGPATSPTAVSPDGLNLPARSYSHLVVDVVGTSASAVSFRWLITGRPGWSAPIACSMAAPRDGTAQCQINDLTKSSPEWSGDIRQLEVSFPGAYGSVNVDRVQLVGAVVPQPLVGAIRWDGWFPGNSFVDPSLFTDFDYRQPLYGWFDAPGPAATPADAAGTTALTQHQLDVLTEMRQAKAGGIDFWAFNWYAGQPELPHDPSGPNPYTSALSDYESYVAGLRSGQRPLLDYALILEPGVARTDRKANHLDNTPFWSNVIIPRLIQHFQQSAYVKVAGNRPLVYWFSSADLSGATGFGDCTKPNGGCWRTALDELIRRVASTPGLGAPYFVDARSDASAAETFGFDGLTSYGPGVVSPLTYADNGHQDWVTTGSSLTPVSIDNAVASQTVVTTKGQMLAIQPALTPTLDHRAQNTGTQYAVDHHYQASFWFEYPTYSEWETHFRSIYDDLMLYPGRSSKPGVALIYAWNEISEGGGIVPSTQYGSYLLDAIAAVRTGAYPAQFWNTWNDSNTAVIHYAGGWQEAGPGPDYSTTRRVQRYPTSPVPGAYTNDEHLDPNGAANLNDKATVDVGAASAVRLIATVGPDRGIAHVDVDGQGKDVDLYATTTTRQAIVFELDGLARARHRLTVSATGRANPRATASTIGVDAVSALRTRLGVGGPGLVAPSRVSAAGFAGMVNLSWDPVEGATGYDVYRSVSPDGPWQRIEVVGPSSQPLSYGDTTVPSGMRVWYYQVRTRAGDQDGPSSDVVPGITVDDLARGGTTSSGTGPEGSWEQVLFASGARHMADEVMLSSAPGNARLTVEATTDGSTWKPVYQNQPPGGPTAALGDRRWVTFPAIAATGLRVTVSGVTAPPSFQAYFR